MGDKKEVAAFTLNFNQLVGASKDSVENFYPRSLKIDSYQRPFVWGQEKIEQLLNDLLSYVQHDKPFPYFMGTLLLHEKGDCYYVIDGQQRLTSLAVLFHQIKGTLPQGIDFEFTSEISVRHIKQAKRLFQVQGTDLPLSLFDQLVFTVIQVVDEDQAFTFFDTQNSRGVSLSATDLLKAYHLRAIESTEAINAQAQVWEEEVQQIQGASHAATDFAPELFTHYLWTSRRWRGRYFPGRSEKNAMLQEFKAGCITEPPDQEFKGMRRPLFAGKPFFDYTAHYAQLFVQLFRTPPDTKPSTTDEHLNSVRWIYWQVIQEAGLSIYLRRLFELGTLFFYDRFKDTFTQGGASYLKLFAHWLEHWLGVLRLENASVRRETPINACLREPSENLLDVIQMAYRPQEVVDFVSLQAEKRQKKLVDNKVLKFGARTVRSRYLDVIEKAAADPYQDGFGKIKAQLIEVGRQAREQGVNNNE